MNGTRDPERQHARLLVGAGPAQTVSRSSNALAPKNATKQPNRQIAVVGALHGDGEFRIGEGEIDDGAQPVAFDLIGDEMAENLGDRHHAHRDPERLAADAAVKAVEEVGPIHRRNRLQSRSNSLMLVLARVFSSTRLTITAQVEARAWLRRSLLGLPGMVPGTTTE